MRQSHNLQLRSLPAAVRPDYARLRLDDHTSVSVRSNGPAAARRSYRTSLRRQIPFETLVNRGMTYSVPWNIVNLGLGGALVEMDRTTVRVGTTIRFELRFIHRGRHVQHIIPAKVVRLERRGVALQFGDYSDEAYTDLTNFLYDLEG